MFLTIPETILPSSNAEISQRPFLKGIAGNSSLGSKPGFKSSLIISLSVASPTSNSFAF